jgi:hypothetical protein
MFMKASEVGSPAFIKKVFRAEEVKNMLLMSCLAMSSHIVMVAAAWQATYNAIVVAAELFHAGMPPSHAEIVPTLLNHALVLKASPSNTVSVRLLAPNP